MSAQYVLKRVLQMFLVVWAAYTLVFAILWVIPGDPLEIIVAKQDMDIASLSPDEIAVLKQRYGLDRGPVGLYFSLLLGSLRGDFGTSFVRQVPVLPLIAEKATGTIQLSLFALVLVVVFGVSIAYLANVVQWPPLKWVLRRLPALGVSVPSFWVGLLLIQVFSFDLGWFPSMGDDRTWRTLALPALTMSVGPSAVLAQVLDKGLQNVLAQPHMVTARAIGLSRGQAQFRHALRNACLPALTTLGLLFGETVTASIVVETVFTRNGIGQLVQQAVLNQDVPVVQGIVVLASAVFVLINLLVDLLYPLLDKRISVETRSA
ncbi:ABC transporter permease [Brooklawnia cerclae]|uniref:Peptide/nickel transport system permease protein n=1 Tax=Brooklawnia cerclae TaxID=349934 RepID=A0ABX0SL49_9ACTN|nr:ABC transporter permease [Brooklawnia cerclae]NIH58690.1 peptide/nickel transport system permease protein [Brooklawnia cerclae]